MNEKNLHPNFYNCNEWYSLTINPSDQYQKFNTLERFESFIKMIKVLFYEIFDSKGIAYIGNVEASEPKLLIESKGPRLHYHGRFLFRHAKEIYDWLIYDLSKLARLGSIDIDNCNDLRCWDHYCRKQSMIMPERACLYNSYTLLVIQMKNAEYYVKPPEGDGASRGDPENKE